MIKIEVLYNNNIIPLELPQTSNNYYELLIEQIKEHIIDISKLDNIKLKFNDNDYENITFNENNFNNIVKEDIEKESIKLELINDNVIAKNDNVMDFINGEDIKNHTNINRIDSFDDDLDDNLKNNKNSDINNSNNDDNEVIDCGNNIKNINVNSKNIDNISNKENLENIDNIDINLSINDELNNKNKGKNDSTLISNVIKSIPENDNDINLINNNINCDNKNNINKNDNIESNNNIENNDNKGNFNINEFINIKCGLCNFGIKGCKYQCCICDNLILCKMCEVNHEHPCIKFKSKNLSNLYDCFNYIRKRYNNIDDFSLNPINFVKELIGDSIKVNICTNIDRTILIEPNKNFEIPILITNNSEKEINSENFIIIAKNFKWINIKYDFQHKYIVKPHEIYQTKLICQSSENIGKNIVIVEIYSNIYKFETDKNNQTNIEFNMIVSKDEENTFFCKEYIMYPRIVLLDKVKKKLIERIINNKTMPDKNPNEIYDILRDNQWNTIDALQAYNAKKLNNNNNDINIDIFNNGNENDKNIKTIKK